MSTETRCKYVLENLNIVENHSYFQVCCVATWVSCIGWQMPIGCLKLQIYSCKRATSNRALLRKIYHKDKVSNGFSPPFIQVLTLFTAINRCVLWCAEYILCSKENRFYLSMRREWVLCVRVSDKSGRLQKFRALQKRLYSAKGTYNIVFFYRAEYSLLIGLIYPPLGRLWVATISTVL